MNQRWDNSAEFAGEISPIPWHVSWYLAANRDRLSQDETSGGNENAAYAFLIAQTAGKHAHPRYRHSKRG